MDPTTVQAAIFWPKGIFDAALNNKSWLDFFKNGSTVSKILAQAQNAKEVKISSHTNLLRQCLQELPNRGCHGSSGKLNFPGKPKLVRFLVRFLRSQWQPVVREGAVMPLLVHGVCRFKPRGIVYLCTKSGPNHMQYTNLTK